MALEFELTKQYGTGIEKVVAKFAEQKEALEFIDAKAAWDHKTKVATIYRLYQFDTLILEIDSMQYEDNGVNNAGGAGKGARPSISPLSTRPSPLGGIGGNANYHNNNEDNDDDDDTL